MFQLYRIAFQSVTEQTVFNGNSISFWAVLEHLFISIKNRELRISISFDIDKYNLRSIKFLTHLLNHAELSSSGTKENGTYHFQGWSVPTAVQYNNHSQK